MKSNFSKAQVSVETLIAIGIVLVFFVSIIFYVYSLNQATNNFSNAFTNRATCLRLAFVLSEAYSEGPGASTKYYLEADVNVIGPNRLVWVNDDYCSVLANLPNQNLFVPKGLINIDTNSERVVNISW